MATEELEVLPMTAEDIDGAIETIQKAFAEDPYNKWIFNDRSQFSPARNHYSLSLRCHWGMTHGLFYVCRTKAAPHKVLGTAMWLAPQPVLTAAQSWTSPRAWHGWAGAWWLWMQQGWMNLWYGRGGLNVRRYWLWKAAQAAAQAELWTDPRGYYFCNIVTVLPEAQGKGVGRKLMEVVLKEADEKGLPCYLESSRREPNVAIYERFGFKLRKEMLCDDEGEAITLYCMTREPVKGAEAERSERGDGISNGWEEAHVEE